LKVICTSGTPLKLCSTPVARACAVDRELPLPQLLSIAQPVNSFGSFVHGRSERDLLKRLSFDTGKMIEGGAAATATAVVVPSSDIERLRVQMLAYVQRANESGADESGTFAYEDISSSGTSDTEGAKSDDDSDASDDGPAPPNQKLILIADNVLKALLVSTSTVAVPSGLLLDEGTGACHFEWTNELYGHLLIAFENAKICSIRWPNGKCEQRVLVADFKRLDMKYCVTLSVRFIKAVFDDLAARTAELTRDLNARGPAEV
jgi:hypothetical protein